MWPDRVSSPRPLAPESDLLLAVLCRLTENSLRITAWYLQCLELCAYMHANIIMLHGYGDIYVFPVQAISAHCTDVWIFKNMQLH